MTHPNPDHIDRWLNKHRERGTTWDEVVAALEFMEEATVIYTPRENVVRVHLARQGSYDFLKAHLPLMEDLARSVLRVHESVPVSFPNRHRGRPVKDAPR